ncbi:hypothetical protein CWM60_28120 [Klebsiella sp. C1-16S-Nf17]|nr:hypothetical protein CWM60_28120 [Klebsiella sp. C1-16S-Nf17]
MPPSGTTAGTAPDRPAALRLPGLRGRRFSVGRIKHLCRHPALPRVRRLTARRRCCLRGPGGKEVFCRPDKAFMPPSGTTAGTAPDRPAALRLPGLRCVSLREGT